MIDTVRCRTACAGLDAVRAGSLLRLSGHHFDGVRRIVFVGTPNPADDAMAPVARGRGRWVEARVPAGAATGPLQAMTADGVRSASSRAIVAVDAARRQLALADGATVEARVEAKRVLVGSGRPAALTLFVRGGQPIELVVELIRAEDGASVARWAPGPLAPGAVHRVAWDGRSGGRAARAGRYEFRVFLGAQAPAGGAQAAQALPPAVSDGFQLETSTFPIRGPHRFGRGFAAGHEGADIFAACGTPLVAARGGTVRFKATHGRAGNYVVIDAGTEDHAYMHLRAPALVERGERVRTGQAIGEVGATGRASGCHLHFERWSAPGWYRGGRATDPLPDLRAWDAAPA